MSSAFHLFARLLIVAASLCAALAAAAAPRHYTGVVTHVTDGDTLWVRPDAGGAPRKLRLLGVDAPEICQSGGPAARDALRTLALHRAVHVAVLGMDDYRRGLARVTRLGQRAKRAPHGDDLARALVLQGQAWSYRYRNDPGPFAREERQARARRRGLFALHPGAPWPEHPRDFRRRHGPCEHG